MRDLKNIDEFAYSASHDLKQPIRNVKSFANLLQKHLLKNDGLDDTSEEYFDFILSSINSMESLVNDLNDFATIGSMGENKQNVTLESFLKIHEAKVQKSNPSIPISISLKSLPVVEGFPELLKMLIQKLIDNAIKFRADDHVKIYISGEETVSNWKFEVRDEGIGIEEDNSEKIFMPFVKIHKTNQIKGAGLGLAICKKIVEMHNGKIWTQSKINEGTRFFFTISKSKEGEATRPSSLSNGQRSVISY